MLMKTMLEEDMKDKRKAISDKGMEHSTTRRVEGTLEHGRTIRCTEKEHCITQITK